MKASKIVLPVAALLLTVLSYTAQAQCKTFIRKTCMPKVLPFTHNGQLNSASMNAGQSAELQMTFYSGQEYRIVVCSQETLGKVSFRVLDGSRNEVFNSKLNKDAASWDFKMGATQQLTIEINVPEAASPNSLVPNGCVAVLVGFKK
jgi:hypothetical protein